jgi:hypothetical protein
MLTKQEFTNIRGEIEKSLEKIAEKYNINMKAGKIKYDTNKFDVCLSCTKKEVNGKSFEQSEFEKYCHFFNLNKNDYMKEVKNPISGKTFIITGFALTSKKYPILAKCKEDNKTYKLPESIVKFQEV